MFKKHKLIFFVSSVNPSAKTSQPASPVWSSFQHSQVGVKLVSQLVLQPDQLKPACPAETKLENQLKPGNKILTVFLVEIEAGPQAKLDQHDLYVEIE